MARPTDGLGGLLDARRDAAVALAGFRANAAALHDVFLGRLFADFELALAEDDLHLAR